MRFPARCCGKSAGWPACRCSCLQTGADLPGGSTLGNLQSHTLPIPMADIGLAQLGMHSAVETAATADAAAMVRTVAQFYTVHLRCLGDGQYTLEALA